MKNERILISGAGIAGQTLAYWLARYGFRPTVIERAPRLRSGGQGVDVRDHAIDVIERMGILPQVRAAAAAVEGMRFVNPDGREIGRIDIQAIKDENGSAEVEIMRGDLITLLYEATAETVEYRFGDWIRGLESDDDGVTVTFEHGSAERFDLVIGADGLHSAVRRMAFGAETDVVRHLGHYFAFGNADAALGPDRSMTVHNTPGRFTGLYRSGTHPQAKAYFMFRSPELEFDYRDPDSAPRLLREQFGNRTAWRIPQLLDGILADPDLYFDALAQVRMDAWSTGRVALVGDAAYCASPVSGAGAELSLVGAYLLAGELAAAGGEHRTAFRRYELSHRPLVDRKQRIGTNLRLMVPASRIGMAVRDTVIRLPLLESMAGMERIMAPGTTEPLPEFEPLAEGAPIPAPDSARVARCANWHRAA